MSDPFVAEIRIFPYDFAPVGWAFCDGQIMAISQNNALFSLLRNTFGGDGKKTFGLPQLQTRCVVGAGQGPGLTNYALGETAGENTVTLTSQTTPAHTHAFKVLNPLVPPTDSIPDNTMAAGKSTVVSAYVTRVGTATTMNPSAISPSGPSVTLPHENRMPYQGLSYCIALAGNVPQRP
jgi:microcystin-dependent protein